MLLSKASLNQIIRSLQIDRRSLFALYLPDRNAPSYDQFLHNYINNSGPNITYTPVQVFLDRAYKLTYPKIAPKVRRIFSLPVSNDTPSIVWDTNPLMTSAEIKYSTYYVRSQYATFVDQLAKYVEESSKLTKWLILVTTPEDWKTTNVNRNELFRSRMYLFYYFASLKNKQLLDKDETEIKIEAKSIPFNVLLIVASNKTDKWIGYVLQNHSPLAANRFVTDLRSGLRYIEEIESRIKDKSSSSIASLEILKKQEKIVDKQKEVDQTEEQPKTVKDIVSSYTRDKKVINNVTQSYKKSSALIQRILPQVSKERDSIEKITQALHFGNTHQLKVPTTTDVKQTVNQIQSGEIKSVLAQSRIINLKASDVTIYESAQTTSNKDIEASLEKFPKLFNVTDYSIENVKQTDYKSHDVSKSTLSLYEFTIADKEGNQKELKLLLPKFDKQGVFYYHNTPYQIRHMLAPNIISVPKPFIVRFDGLFTHFILEYRHVFNRNVFYIDIYKYKLPLILVLLALVKPKTVLDYFGLPSFNIEDGKNLTEVQTAILNTYSILKLKGDPLDQTTYSTYLDQITNTPNYYSRLVKYVKRMPDFLVEEYCKAHGIKLTLIDILDYMIRRCLSGSITSLTSVKDLRTQNTSLYLFKILSQWLNLQEQRQLLQLKDVSLPPDAFLKYMRQHGIAVTADLLNPVASMRYTSTVAYAHLSEGSAEHRDFNQENRGVIDPIDTPSGDSIGLIQHTAASAIEINNQLGTTNLDYPFGITPSLVPWAKTNDGIRLMMACSHVRQAIPLSVPDVPLIQTTFESAIKELSPYIIRSPISGTVINEDPLQIKIDDKIKTTPLQDGVTTNKQLVTYSPVVKVNQKVKENEIIAVANEFHKKGPLTLGKTLYVAYFTTPYTFEDAVVINTNAQEALTSVSANKLQILVTKDQQLISVPKSEIIERGKPIFILSHATDANVIDSDLTDFIFTQNNGRLIIRAHKNVTVRSIRVYARPNRKEELEKLGLHPIINPHLTFKGQIIDIYIEAIISWKSVAVLGDKLTNRYGTKGVISKVFEVGDVVDDEGKPIDMLINSQTVVGRKNLGQFYELYASNLVMFARDKITKMNKDEALQFLREVFGPLDNTGEKQLALAATLTTFMSTGEVVLYVPPFKEPTYSQLRTQMLKYNVKTTATITFKQLGTTTEIEVPVGYLYIYKLMQESEKKTTARATGVYSSLGMPMKTKETGAQSLDELSLYTLLSSNTPYLLKELHEVETIDSKAREQMIKNIIEKGSSSLLELDVTNLGNKYLNPLLNVLGISL